jgi:hypothetical protein
MTATLTYRPTSCADEYSPSHATSDVAQRLMDWIREWLHSATRARTLQGQAIEELADRFLDCREDNWDGYGAEKVEDEAFLRARDLLTRLATRFPAPTASASPHGSLTMEWIVNPRRRLILSVGTGEQIAYAAVFGSETVQGVATFVRDVPQEITRHLSRLFFA